MIPVRNAHVTGSQTPHDLKDVVEHAWEIDVERGGAAERVELTLGVKTGVEMENINELSVNTGVKGGGIEEMSVNMRVKGEDIDGTSVEIPLPNEMARFIVNDVTAVNDQIAVLAVVDGALGVEIPSSGETNVALEGDDPIILRTPLTQAHIALLGPEDPGPSKVSLIPRRLYWLEGLKQTTMHASMVVCF